jgi:transposase-like protein
MRFPIRAVIAKKNVQSSKSRERRTFTNVFKREAVQVLLNRHSVTSVSIILRIGNVNFLYHREADIIASTGPTAKAPDNQLSDLRDELQRTRRVRDPLKNALVSLRRQE